MFSLLFFCRCSFDWNKIEWKVANNQFLTTIVFSDISPAPNYNLPLFFLSSRGGGNLATRKSVFVVLSPAEPEQPFFLGPAAIFAVTTIIHNYISDRLQSLVIVMALLCSNEILGKGEIEEKLNRNCK